MEVIKAAEDAAIAEAEAATFGAAAVAVAHGFITQEEVDALKRYLSVALLLTNDSCFCAVRTSR